MMIPENDKRIKIFYFSGSGNTQIISDGIEDTFKNRGFPVESMRIEETESVQVLDGDMIGIGFPVAMFSTYPIVLKFLFNLPNVSNVPIFGFNTLAGAYPWGLVGKLHSILSKKGYIPIAFKQFLMPNNLFIKMPEKMRKKRMLRGAEDAEKFVDSIISGKCNWNRVPIVSNIMFFLFSQLVKVSEMPLHQKLLKIGVMHEKCIQCGICAKKCPVENISFDSKILIGNNCQYCFRCVAVCPVQATFGIATARNNHYRAEGSHL